MTKTLWEQYELFDASPYIKKPVFPELRTRTQVLEDAKALINGDRAIQYGDAFDTHARIARMWDAAIGEEPVIKAHDVALMMICVKIIRAQKNPDYRDSWVDIAGYAALGAEFASVK